MTQQATELLSHALALNELDRGEVAVKLIESLDPVVENDAEAAWNAEIEQRLEQVRSGQVRTVPWPEARQMILDGADDSDED